MRPSPTSPAPCLVSIVAAALAISTTAHALRAVRQTQPSILTDVLDRRFKLAGKLASTTCPDSLRLAKTSSLAGSDITKRFDGLDVGNSTSPLVASMEKFLQIVRYEDIYFAGDRCTGDGEVILATPSALQSIATMIPLLQDSVGLDIDLFSLSESAGIVANLTKEHGVAVGFDDSPGPCANDSNAMLPASMVWINDLAAHAPAIAKKAGIKRPKKGDMYLVTAAAHAKSPESVNNADEPLCVFKAANSVAPSNSSTSAASDPSSRGKKNESESACFPARAQVVLQSGRAVRMDQVSIGDHVQVGPGRYSPVFMFTHKLPSLVHPFVTLVTASGARLTLTKGHYLYANGALVPASQLSVGASVTLASGAVDRVTTIFTENAEGLYNPQTVSGDVVVNGVVASTYTTAVHPALAHALLSPFRFMQGMGWQCSAFESGSGALPVRALRTAATL